MAIPISLILELLKNFPAVVLDLKEIPVFPGEKVDKSLHFESAASEIDVKVSVNNKTRSNKKYKAIIFITDL